MTPLSPDLLKARLDVILAFADGRDLKRATRSWISVEPQAEDGMGVKLVEAMAQVIGDDRLLTLVLFASTTFRLELAEAANGGR